MNYANAMLTQFCIGLHVSSIPGRKCLRVIALLRVIVPHGQRGLSDLGRPPAKLFRASEALRRMRESLRTDVQRFREG